jgi:glycosyltransferase involved in cell wall biosynthesis
MKSSNKRKIVLVTNHLTPYRRKFYDDFFLACKKKDIEFSVLLMTKREPRRNWDYENLKVDYAYLMKGNHYSFPINNHLNLEVVGKLKEIKPDVILMAGSYMYYTNWLVLLNKKKINAPIIYWNEAHFNEKRDYNKLTIKIRDHFRNVIFNRFDGYWYSGQMSKNFVNHYSNKSVKLYFLPNFIDNEIYQSGSIKNETEIIEIKSRFNIPLVNTVIIIPARLSLVKGIHLFIDLLGKVDNNKNITVLIPGTGEYEDVIADKISRSGLDIRLLGFQEQKVMVELYAVTKIFMLPSLSDPNPLTCIEALWCKLPLFISNHVGNYPEVVKEGVNGYVFDYSKSEEALIKLNEILSADEDWHKKASDASLEIAKTIYKSELVIQNIINEMATDFFKA